MLRHSYSYVFFSLINRRNEYGMRMETYFIPPTTGNYQFRIACDNMCEFNLGGDATGSQKNLVLDLRVWDLFTPMFTFNQ